MLASLRIIRTEVALTTHWRGRLTSLLENRVVWSPPLEGIVRSFDSHHMAADYRMIEKTRGMSFWVGDNSPFNGLTRELVEREHWFACWDWF